VFQGVCEKLLKVGLLELSDDYFRNHGQVVVPKPEMENACEKDIQVKTEKYMRMCDDFKRPEPTVYG
jgi:DNA primase large subunit